MTDQTPEIGPGGRTSEPTFPRADAELIERFRNLPTANIVDVMDRLGAADRAIKPVWPGARLAGSAFTIWTRPGDNLGIHRSLESVQPGDVIVVNGGGDENRALIGELIGGRAKVAGAEGFVIDGAVRDADGLAQYDMPVFARAQTPAGPYKDGPFITCVAVAMGGVVVQPGDIVVADADGVAVIPLASAAIIAERAEAKYAQEEAARAEIEAGLG
ncbi:MAG: hypothetical protein KDB16_04045 [Acidimicrobiales bacterium]|nr:hypothetical protein [Acidimicrobiales bacterium]